MGMALRLRWSSPLVVLLHVAARHRPLLLLLLLLLLLPSTQVASGSCSDGSWP